MPKLDLNCDLGEGEPPARTRALASLVTSINVACGAHAGTPESMALCTRLAAEYRVRLGAHPGLPDRTHFGRLPIPLTPDEFELLLLHQVGALAVVASAHGIRLRHIKLHGALYHMSENSPAIRRRFLETVHRHWPRTRIFALAGGRVAAAARKKGLRVWEEAFADRHYDSTGRLLPRSHPAALLSRPADLRDRVRRLRHGLPILAHDGTPLTLRPDTLCLHADSPGALRNARIAAAESRPAGADIS